MMQIDVVDPTLSGVIGYCTGAMEPQCRAAKLEFTLENSAGDVVMRADEPRLRQIVSNLLSNAIKFTQPGGHVYLRVRMADPDTYEIEVEDTGIGMTQDDIVLAMAPFGQVDGSLSRRFDGVGLGLPLARALVELHGGRLTITSAPGRGTVARVTMPRDPAARSANIHTFPKRGFALH